MTTIMNKKITKILLILLFLYWLPFLYIFVTHQSHQKIESLPVSDAVIVFGTLVRDGKVSPLLKERLDASIAIYQANKVEQIVVSNRAKASAVMHQYLLENGIPPEAIAVDNSADKTPDTCRYEKKIYSNPRKLIFVSQAYHLPRIAYQCKKLGITAVSFPAENIRKQRASLFSSFDVFFIRTKRYFREAGLTLLALLGIYS